MENNNGEGILAQIENYPKSNYALLQAPTQLDAVFQSIVDKQKLLSLPEYVQAQEEYIQRMHQIYGTIFNKMATEEKKNILKLASYYANAVDNSPITKLQADEEE